MTTAARVTGERDFSRANKPAAGAAVDSSRSFMARRALEQGDPQRAIEICESALEGVSDPVDLTVLAARAEAAMGRYSEAAERLERAMASHPFNVDLLLLRARIAHGEDAQEQALGLLRRIEVQDPYNVSGAVLQTRVLVALGRTDEARDLMRAAAGFRPNSLPILFNLARLIDNADHFTEFRRIWLRKRQEPAAFANAARPFVTGCLRAREYKAAISVLQRATIIVLNAAGAIRPRVRDRELGGDGRRALIDVVTRLRDHGVPHFLAAGTALGAVREGRLLGFDTDIDIGIFEDDYNKDRLIKIFREDPNFRIQETDPNNPKVGLQHWNGVSIDIFRFYSEAGKIWHNGTFIRWWNTPFGLSDIELYGRRMSIPDNIELYFSECYGDWRAPAPDFDAFFEGPNAETIWDDYLNVYLHRKVFELICNGNIGLARKYIDRFPKLFVWLRKDLLSSYSRSVEI